MGRYSIRFRILSQERCESMQPARHEELGLDYRIDEKQGKSLKGILLTSEKGYV